VSDSFGTGRWIGAALGSDAGLSSQDKMAFATGGCFFAFFDAFLEGFADGAALTFFENRERDSFSWPY
jgi:hypothetical protein